MRHVRSMKDDELVQKIVLYYYVQLILVIVLCFALTPFISFWPAFALGTMNPITRLPLFKMGIVLGELVNRTQRDNVALSQIRLEAVCFLFPYISKTSSKFSEVTALDETEKKNMQDSDKDYWKKTAFNYSLFLLIITLVVAIASIFAAVLGLVWLQAIVPYAQAVIILSLTLDNGESRPAKFLRSKLFTSLGVIGMTIYCLVRNYPIHHYYFLLL